MKKRKLFISVLIAIVLIGFCSLGFAQEQVSISDTVIKIIKQVQQKYRPDKRISRFEVTPKFNRSNIVLKGETLSPEGKSELIARLHTETSYQVEDSLLVLPDPALGGNVYGIVRISVAQLRRHPDEIEEIVDQATMGSEAQVLKIAHRYWVYCQLDDEYLGWMTISSLKIGDQNFITQWRKQDKLVVTANYGQIWEKPSTRSLRSVSDVVKGNILIKREMKRKWTTVELPDGRIGYIQSNLVANEQNFKNNLQFKSIDEFLSKAYAFLGLPYLWGGRTTKGFDCSGFTQTVFKLNGITLPRDANMQVKVGTEIILNDSLTNLKPGDLLFFGRDIDHIFHVGIYIGNYQFMQSDGLVRINSFNPEHENYSEYRRKGLRAVRRVLGN
jgi:cell wall-associated NlpC family hydrolase